MSQARAISSPPPSAYPLIAATLGCGRSASSSMSRLRCILSRRATGSSGSLASLRSMPAQKYRAPAPVSTLTRTSRSAATTRQSEASSSRMIWLRACADLARLRRTVRTPSSRCVRTVSPDCPGLSSVMTGPGADSPSLVVVYSVPGRAAQPAGGYQILEEEPGAVLLADHGVLPQRLRELPGRGDGRIAGLQPADDFDQAHQHDGVELFRCHVAQRDLVPSHGCQLSDT